MRTARTQRRGGLLGGAVLVAAALLVGAVVLVRCSPPGFSGSGDRRTVQAESARPDAGQVARRSPEAPSKPVAVAPDPPPPEDPGAKPAKQGGAPDPVKPAAPEAPVKEGPPLPAGPVDVVCPDPATAPAWLFFSPARPKAGKPLRVVAISEQELAATGIFLADTREPVAVEHFESWGGPPWAWSATLDAPASGSHRLVLASREPARPFACGEVVVQQNGTPNDIPPIAGGAWDVERQWDRRMEQLYSAWIGRLFLVDIGAKAGWRPLHQVTRDRKRNILFGHLGMREDDPEAKAKVILQPDCADTPFFLRTYFSWKMRLPFAMRDCSRGDCIRGPECARDLVTNLIPEFDDVNSQIERFNKFVGLAVARTIHSGTARTLPEDATSDLYPVALTREALRPGTVFTDPNGHLLVVTRWIPGTEEQMGMLLAVDAHPDLTVSHKRFSPANFYFAAHLRTGGFKAFRPPIYSRGEIRFPTNDELMADADYANLSLDQYAFSESAQFYRTVDKLLNPLPLDPVRAYRSRMEALVELLEERVSSVQVGVDFMNATGWAEIPMPEGGLIFETTGPWEDYSTPARDLRLLIAFDELLNFPAYVGDNPDMFRLPQGKTMAQVRADMDAEWARAKDELSISYRRSDRSPWTLTLGRIVERAAQFEQAYNPNDCPEIRWGAGERTEEYSTCNRHAPREQLQRMAAYRYWHQERRRPAGF